MKGYSVLSLLLIAWVIFLFLRLFSVIVDRKIINHGHSWLTALYGSIGVPIHEIGHLCLCLIFKHSVLHVEIYHPKPDGQLGVVEHSYNNNSLYQRLGCVFIAIAPIPAGLLACFVLTKILEPNINIDGLLNDTSSLIFQHGLLAAIAHIANNEISTHYYLFKLDWQNYLIWAFCLTSIIKHMLPSKADVANLYKGLFALCLAFLLCYSLQPDLVVNYGARFAISLLSLQIVFVGYAVALQLLILFISYIFKKEVQDV